MTKNKAVQVIEVQLDTRGVQNDMSALNKTLKLLATIQEAVANVMVDMIPAMMAGFEAVVNEQRATRQAVESIELGDTVIGQAAARYSRKMAVIKGG